MIFNKDMETMSRTDMEQLQIERLQSTLNRVYRNVAFYKQVFDDKKVNIEKIKTKKDLRNLPFTTRLDLNKSYPYDMFAVPLRDIVRIHSTSGTTGKPVVVGYTKNDLRHWTDCTARILAAAGITEHDVVQIAFHYDLFTGGFGFHQGAELIGASVIPASTSPIEKQILIMKDFKTTALACAPSFALHISRMLEEQKIHPENLFLKVGIFGSEPWSELMRSKIETGLHLSSKDTYGLTEIIGPGVAGECEFYNGLHINEDHFIVEVVDTKTLEPLSPGEEGELVFTTITKEGFPLIRYRTGDIASIISNEPCGCGRTTVRISRIAGRTDDMIFFEGIKILPSQIEEILLNTQGITPHFRIILERKEDKDSMEVQVEISKSLPGIDELRYLENLRDSIASKIETTIDVQAKIHLAEPGSIRGEDKDKVRRVVDKRGEK
ncbi:MAG: phenylacetate--CoA ligase [Spirochaetales bacterium]|nr:phenylacetate--CoA ligase [Spirochaetales bacterium]